MSLLRRLFGITDIPTAAAARTQPVIETKPTNTTNPDLPQKVKEKLPDVLRRIEEVLARARADSAMTEITQLERMRDDHLEKVLGAYLAVPKEHLSEIYAKTGKSASFHLSDAIEKMCQRVEEISRTLAVEKINVFADNTSFVMQSYDENADTADGNIFLRGIE